MILDVLKNKHLYENVHPNFKKAFDFLEKAQKELPAVGNYEIDGRDVYAFVQEYDTLPIAETKWEAHKKYIDIQFIYEGCEVMGWDTFNNLPEGEEYNEQGDCYVFRTDKKTTDLEVHAGSYAIFFPEDLHRPKGAYKTPGPIKKIVVKVRV